MIVAYLVIRNVARRDLATEVIALDTSPLLALDILLRPIAINKYRSIYINAKNTIAFASLKIKEIYDLRY